MTTFKSLGLNAELLKAVEKLGFETPTDVQDKVIPILLEQDTDLVALAQTGTGKTAAFGFPMLQRIDSTNRRTQGLILSPTPLIAFPYSTMSFVIWIHNSRVGDKISPCVLLLVESILWSIGKPNAAVLPVPVCAKATRSVSCSSNIGITLS